VKIGGTWGFANGEVTEVPQYFPPFAVEIPRLSKHWVFALISRLHDDPVNWDRECRPLAWRLVRSLVVPTIFPIFVVSDNINQGLHTLPDIGAHACMLEAWQ